MLILWSDTVGKICQWIALSQLRQRIVDDKRRDRVGIRNKKTFTRTVKVLVDLLTSGFILAGQFFQLLVDLLQ